MKDSSPEISGPERLDHTLENDIGVDLAKQYDSPIYSSIRSALHAGEKNQMMLSY